MAYATQTQLQMDKRETELLKELDKGIDDMEKGNVILHENAMKILKERLRSNEL